MARYYDLFVLLDPEAPEERRAEIVEQVKRQIDSGGASLKGDADWGMRRLSYEIDHRREAQYHLFQFEGTAEVLTGLDRSLSIDDSVLRHRIIRLNALPETTPQAPDEAPRRSDERGPARDGGRREPDAGEAVSETPDAAVEPAEAAAPPAPAPPAESEAATPAEGASEAAPPADGDPAQAPEEPA
jgi:small subunit ribosomal protein S6